ncbi:MAG: response regulator [Alphaproteobacteria bacterium]|nr:response regulator [Alphaproteobacteria bacterium]
MTKQILVIDDEDRVRKIVCDNLKLSGFQVSAATDGEEGLSMINPENPPRVVITDIIMPNKNGLEVIAEIRKIFPSIKVIAMSGGGRVKADDDLLEKAEEAGADAVLSKPLDLELLEKTINDFMTS